MARRIPEREYRVPVNLIPFQGLSTNSVLQHRYGPQNLLHLVGYFVNDRAGRNRYCGEAVELGNLFFDSFSLLFDRQAAQSRVRDPHENADEHVPRRDVVELAPELGLLDPEPHSLVRFYQGDSNDVSDFFVERLERAQPKSFLLLDPLLFGRGSEPTLARRIEQFVAVRL